MLIAFIQNEQTDCSNTVSLNHNTSFFEHRRHVEVSRFDLICRITSICSSTDADEVDDAGPVISEIQIVCFGDTIFSLTKALSQFLPYPWHISDAEKTVVVEASQ